jgi:hypothetical protein
MQLSVPEIKLLIMTVPYGLGAEHLTQEERKQARELVSRMVGYCDDIKRTDAIGDGGCGRPRVVCAQT